MVRTLRPSLGVQTRRDRRAGLGGRPETWGLLFLAVELLLLHQAINLGKAGRLYGLIPLFLLWANVDESFAFGLVILAAAVDRALSGRREARPGRGPRRGPG